MKVDNTRLAELIVMYQNAPTVRQALLELQARREAERCPKCEGIGAPWNNSSSVPCDACQGTGKRTTEDATVSPECRNVLFPGDPSTCQYDPCACALLDAEPELLTALCGLLALCEKQWGMLEATAQAGVATLSPPGVKFDDLKFVQKARAAISQYEQKERG